MGRTTRSQSAAAADTGQPTTPHPAASLVAFTASPDPPPHGNNGRRAIAALPGTSAPAGAHGPAFELRLSGPPAGRNKRGVVHQSCEAAADAAVQPSAAVPDAVPADVVGDLPASAAPKAEPEVIRRMRRRCTAPAPHKGQAGPQAAAVNAGKQADGGGQEAVPKMKKGGSRRREPDPPPLADLPTAGYLARLRARGYKPPPLPVPNLGYACLNTVLAGLKPPIFTSRDCRKATMEAKGLLHLGALALQNCRDLVILIQWNAEKDIRFFRMSSVLWPWMGTFDPRDLQQFEDISAMLRFAGDLARLHGQRVTFHPSHYVKLAAPDTQLAAKSIKELEAHSQILDLMGYEPSPENKINIHLGGVYSNIGSKEDTMRRWAANFMRLSPNCRARMTVENDDVASAFSLEDLLFLHKLCGVPLVFDFHHHRFCPGSLTAQEALEAAVKTWPRGVRPVVHWSESPEDKGKKPNAHSDYVRGPITLHGFQYKVDVMIEAKMKEQALLAYRGDIPFPQTVATWAEPPIGNEEAVAMELL